MKARNHMKQTIVIPCSALLMSLTTFAEPADGLIGHWKMDAIKSKAGGYFHDVRACKTTCYFGRE